ncbi:MAG: fumarylacetoacetate hydrolase [Planctomycetaceae bacterium]|nr:fumarylacetoacetate hydrolase [Planctomycetaceae bacterium]
MGLSVLLSAQGIGQEKITKYLRFRVGRTAAYGILEGDVVRQLKGNLFGKWQPTDQTYPLKEVRILVPSPRPSKVIALAGNYKDHLGDKEPPKTPEPFFKLPSCLLRHGGRIIQPKDHAPVHYEAELVVVIGKRAKKVSPEQALDFVLGITCGNDISARDWQSNDVQWWRAKGSDTFGPVGPYIVSGLDYNNLTMELRVNGEVRQKTNTKNQIHNLAQTISFISNRVTLNPGDLIFTGTPGMTKGMEIGDTVEVEIEGVGILRNKLVAEK